MAVEPERPSKDFSRLPRVPSVRVFNAVADSGKEKVEMGSSPWVPIRS